jgi:hypothetical protein
MEKTHDALCPRCKAVVLGAANCCWQCGEYVLVETQSALAETSATLNGHGPLSDPVLRETGHIETGRIENQADATNGQPIEVHFVGEVAEISGLGSTLTAPGDEAISAELVDVIPVDADPNGILMGPTVLRSSVSNESPREVRSGSPFSNAVEAPTAPQKALGVLSPATRPREELGWHNVLIDAAPYGCLPLVVYAVLSSWGAGWSFKAGVVAAFFALCFGLPGLLGPRWKWCLGGMMIAAPILVIASWQILLGR